jgi:hypothetical protein
MARDFKLPTSIHSLLEHGPAGVAFSCFAGASAAPPGQGEYGKDRPRNVISLTTRARWIGLISSREEGKNLPKRPQRADRYNLSDLFNSGTKDF